MTDATDDSTDDRVEEAVDILERFGFTEYESRFFVALTRIGTGTAREISEVADVPRALVYDCVDALQEAGLVDVQQSSPKQYRSVAPETAVETIEREYQDHLDRLGTLLPRLGRTPTESQEGNVWMVEGVAAVGERLANLIDQAEREVLVAVATEGLVDTDLLDALARAADRSVDVTVGSPGAPVRERIRVAAPEATVVETWTWWEEFPVLPGALTSVLLVDDRALCVSSDADERLDVERHRAVWTDSEGTPLVPMMRPLLARAVTGDLPTES
jgi:predicted transcriptional regulator